MKKRILAFLASCVVFCLFATTAVLAEEAVVAEYDGGHTDIEPDNNMGSTVADKVPAELIALPQEDWTSAMGDTLSTACDWVRNSEQGKLYLLCMGAAGKTAVSANVNQYISEVSLRKEYQELILLPYDILNVTFSGYSATNILGKDLISQLASSSQIDSSDLYTVAYTLLALNSNRYTISSAYKNSQINLSSALLNFQNPDGGFSSYIGSSSAVVQTGLAVTALAPYYFDEPFTHAIDSALEYLSSVQQPDGGFLDNDVPSSIADSKVIVALNSIGIPLRDNRFTKNSKSSLDALMQCLSTDGGFASRTGAQSDVLATENAVLALASIKKKHSPYELDTTLYPNSTKMAENIVISKVHKVSLARPILYCLLGLLGLVLVIFLIISRFHPLRYIEKQEEKRQETQ